MRSSFLPLVAVWLIPGCVAVDPLQHSPPSASARYEDPRQAALVRQLESQPDASSDLLPEPNAQLTLSQLIDIAQRNNRTTQIAWLQARAAAVATGLAAADYYPMLAVIASYGGGYLDFDSSANNSLGGALAATSFVAGPEISLIDQGVSTGGVIRSGLGDTYTNLLSGAGLRWLLFDFGTRDQRQRAAVSDQLAANLRFTAAHQNLAFRVTEAYYELQAAQRRREAARVSLVSATEVLEAVQAQFDRGLVTEPDLMKAREVKAQADFQLVTASSGVEIARVDLATASGLPPGTSFRTAPTNFAKLTSALQVPLDDHIRAALRQRPDLLAQFSNVQAAEARLRAARTDRLPTLALDAVAQYNRFASTGESSALLGRVTEDFQNYGGFLTVQWPVFTGFAEENQTRLAETARLAAQEELNLMREQVVSEVWKAYVQAKNAVASREAAVALEAACRSSYDAALAGFEQGNTPVQETLVAGAALAEAMALVANADAAIAESVTALALSSGGL